MLFAPLPDYGTFCSVFREDFGHFYHCRLASKYITYEDCDKRVNRYFVFLVGTYMVRHLQGEIFQFANQIPANSEG